MKRVIIALAAGLACTTGLPLEIHDITGPFSYEARTEDGTSVLVGTFQFTELGEPAEDQSRSLRGTWAIERRDGELGEVGPQLGSGDFAGTIANGLLLVNLNPMWADNNVYLQGQLDGDAISGTWSYSTMLGDVANGRFVLRPAER